MSDEKPEEPTEPDAAYLNAQDAALAPEIAEKLADRLEEALEAIGRKVTGKDR